MTEPRVIEHDPVASSEALQRVLTPAQQDARDRQRRLDKIEQARKQGIRPVASKGTGLLFALARRLQDDEPLPSHVLDNGVERTTEACLVDGFRHDRRPVPAELLAVAPDLAAAETLSEFSPSLFAEAKRRGCCDRCRASTTGGQRYD